MGGRCEDKAEGQPIGRNRGLSPDYPYVYHYANLSATKIPWHWHEELEFNYVVSGKVKLITPNETYLFHKNEGFFINSNVLCTMEQELPAVMDSHLFHPVFSVRTF